MRVQMRMHLQVVFSSSRLDSQPETTRHTNGCSCPRSLFAEPQVIPGVQVQDAVRNVPRTVPKPVPFPVPACEARGCVEIPQTQVS